MVKEYDDRFSGKKMMSFKIYIMWCVGGDAVTSAKREETAEE